MKVCLIANPFLQSRCARTAKGSPQAVNAGIRTQLHFLAAVQQDNTSSYTRAAAPTGAIAVLWNPVQLVICTAALHSGCLRRQIRGAKETQLLLSLVLYPIRPCQGLLRAITGLWERCFTVFRSTHNILWEITACPDLWDTTVLTSSGSSVSQTEVSGIHFVVAVANLS